MGEQERARAFEAEGKRAQTGLVAEFMDFLKANGKWWLLPIVVAMLLVAGLAILAGTGAAPFIYTLF